MALNLIDKVELIEVGPRDGFQFEDKIIPVVLKKDIISGLVDAGLKHIQVTSFVHPEKVPQMADADELVKNLSAPDDVVFSGLVLNTRGVERAFDSGLKQVEVSISASDTHSRKNTGMSLGEAIYQGQKMIKLAKKHGMIVRAGVQCAFGCVFEGNIPITNVMRILENYISLNADSLVISDTTGMANPLMIEALLEKLLPVTKNIPIAFHLHDTQGLGLVNLKTALDNGITRFDTALGGMGGCPFVLGAAGNIATEDTVNFLESLGIQTEIDISKVAKCTLKLEKFLNKRFPAKMPHIL